jgi:ubiquinone/menaquinone biosynthesis C-methylase UbiE
VEPKLQRRIQRYGWDRASEFYEGYWQEQLAPAQETLLEMVRLEPGERVLDIACGTGLVAFRAAEAVGREGSVLATDISDSMVGIVARTAAARDLPHVTARRMDAEELHVDDASFDAVLCALGLMYVPDPVVAMEEMHRVLRPGGRAVASVWGKRDRCGWADIFPIVDARVQSEVCPLFFQLGNRDTLEATFKQAGFADVHSERLDTVLHYGSTEDALGAAFLGGPVALAYSRFDERTRDAAHAEYLASIEPFRKEGGYGIPGEFVVTRGVRPAPRRPRTAAERGAAV